MATALGATVVAHDSPGFGLTERSEDLSRYTPKHNARISRAMLGVAERWGWFTQKSFAPFLFQRQLGFSLFKG